MKSLFRLLLLCYLAKVTGKIHVERSGILPVNSKSFGIQFYITLANDAKKKLTITPKTPRCCWRVDKNDLDCKSMELIGGNEMKLSPFKKGNITYVFPNKYPMDRAGSCDFTFVAGEKLLRHKVYFNTTEPKKRSWLDVIGFGGDNYRKCRGVDRVDPRKDCRPVDCVEKYNGWRNFFRNSTGKCEVVHDCYTKGKKGELPEIAFDKDYNDCKSLVSPELTRKQRKQIHDNMEKSKLAKMKYTLEDIKEINPVPLNCHHGRRVGSVCVCDDGWRTKTNNVPKRDLRYIYDWCNVRIKKSKHSRQRALLLAVSFIIQGLSLVGFTLLIGWLVIIWSCFITGSERHVDDSTENRDVLPQRLKALWDIIARLWRRDYHGYVHTTYEPSNDNELHLKKGQRVKDIVKIDDGDGWYEGTCNGVRGYFDQDYVVIKTSETRQQSDSERH
ncbi:hypothetical protein OS493_009590 [Desmophyllum pertusum]|uniref:SH3 domain-containing protein n=1 Tax=Desmophyllum pertusum TaxID=174260 RepID=A0A9W9YR28_9CNID|nr:hypothetical protein OS493_009590 [Desmophyllum pertusum]